MKVFIDIGHPAHVHYFKNFIRRFRYKGHSVVITARDKEMAHYLLRNLEYDYYSRGKGGENFLGKMIYTLKTDVQLLKLALREKPDLFLSYSSPYAAHVSTFIGKPHIAFDDTEHATVGRFLYKPFTDVICTPNCFTKDLGKKQIRFKSYMELSYLHPNVFIPDESIYRYLCIKKAEPYVIIRFVAWEAVHDRGLRGIPHDMKIEAVNTFEKSARVFISSEKELPEELKKYKLNIPQHMIHNALAYASMFYGESATMASESAVLGVPAVYIDNVGRGYTDEQQSRYGLVFNYSESLSDQVKAIEKGVELLHTPKAGWEERRKRLLEENLDLTTFIEYVVEQYPESVDILKTNPGYQTRFNVSSPAYANNM
jgi:uncharacterized protein